MPEPAGPTIEPLGDAAVLVSLGPGVGAAQARHARAIAAAVDAARAVMPDIGRPIPAHATVLIPFDPLAIELDEAVALARRAIAAAADAAGRLAGRPVDEPGAALGASAAIEIPVRYGGRDGPDLDRVAELHGLRPRDVVELHSAARYVVLFLGFAPGFAYLGGLPAGLETPRRDSPRERVPAGSVGIAGIQTGVYPLAMPGGWQLIGRTDAVLFDPAGDPPALLRPGAAVRFVPLAGP
jgi:KipI family sensor histidine kinase inhibitor